MIEIGQNLMNAIGAICYAVVLVVIVGRLL